MRLGNMPAAAGWLALAVICLAARPGVGEEPETEDQPSQSTAQSQRPAAAPRYVFRRDHDPNGIGKFYLGREIAHVVGIGAAAWLERPEREAEESLTKLIEALALQPGQTVADVGAGSGVLTLMMAERVGEDGRVYAVDVQQPMLDLLQKKLKQRGIKQVETVLGTDKSPRLPENSLDLALLVDVYHELAFPYEMMRALSRAMKAGGRVALVEYRLEDDKVPIKLVHKMSEVQVKRELGVPELQLDWKETIEVLPWQHIVIFEKRSVPGKPADADPASSPN